MFKPLQVFKSFKPFSNCNARFVEVGGNVRENNDSCLAPL